MAVAATATQDFSVDELITLSLHMLGTLNADHDAIDVTPGTLRLGRQMLYLELHALKSDGFVLRFIDRYSIDLVLDQAYVDAPADTISVEDGAIVRNVDGYTDRRLTLYTLEEYQRIPDKTVSGSPTHYYPEKTSTGTWRIYLYPVPAGDETALIIPRQRRPRDLLTGDVNVDLDPAWYKALVAWLMTAFAKHYKMTDQLRSLKEDYLAELGRVQSDEHAKGDAMMTLPATPWG